VLITHRTYLSRSVVSVKLDRVGYSITRQVRAQFIQTEVESR
jgi:hypothetical protein